MIRRTKSKPTRRRTQNRLRSRQLEPVKLPFIAHVYELRKRLFYISLSVIAFSGAAALVRSSLTRILLRPAGNQQFIYTSPGGGFNFIVLLCLYAGIAASVPVIVYNLLRYVEPVVHKTTMRFMLGTSAFSGILALIGIVFGYMVGLPAGLHFLLHGFMSNTPQIKALLSIQSYLSFIVTYLLGAALLFQLPLVFVLINRFKPLNARKLLTHQRWVILVAFIVGAIVSPSPDVRSQTIMSLPIIAMYELSVTIIWATNRKHKRPQYVADLLRRDTETRAARLARFQAAQAAWQQSLQASLPGTTSTPVAQPAKPEPIHDRPHQYLDFYQHPYATGR